MNEYKQFHLRKATYNQIKITQNYDKTDKVIIAYKRCNLMSLDTMNYLPFHIQLAACTLWPAAARLYSGAPRVPHIPSAFFCLRFYAGY